MAAKLTPEERAAMKQLAEERKRTEAGLNGEKDVLAAIEAMDPTDKKIATGLHQLVREIAPDLIPRTWYGFPAYARDVKGKEVVFFFQFAGKFGSRYGTLGFNDTARLDDGDMWPTAYALLTWDDAVKQKVAALITQAIG